MSPASLLFQLRDHLHHVSLEHRRVVPVGILKGRGHDVLGQAVQPVRQVATPGLPPRGEELVAPLTQQQGLGAQRLVKPTPAPGVTTTTTLSVIRVPLPLGLGGIVIPTAHLTPTNATGTVQFKDGTTNLSIPLPVVAGIAIGPVSTLRRGTHSLSAVFIPTNPSKFQPSTSTTVTAKF
jgi:Bacterial Ig-like domain (group 3)